ncbi:MAG: hypothetical protein ACKOCX_06290, partial [Planctomycetota bacterium]
PAGASDADAINHAAASRLESLRRVSPGPFTRAHAALVDRVEEARARLLTGAVPSAPLSALPSAAAGLEGWNPSAPPRRRRRSSGNGPLVAAIAALAAAVAVLAFFVIRNEREVALGEPPRGGQEAPGGANAAADTAPKPAGADAAAEAQRAAEAEQRREAEVEKRRQAEAENRRQEAEAEAEQSRQEQEQRMAAEAERRAQEERERDEAERKRVEEERQRMRAAVDRTLGEAYRAIQRQEFDAAMGAIAAAGDQVGDDAEAATRVEHWRLFATYAKEFPTYQERAFSAANAGREFEAEGTRFSIIEINPDTFVYKVGGRIERVPRQAVDPRIAMAVVAAWFEGDGRPANHLFLGARWLSLDPPDLRRARAEWQTANAGGETVKPLLALLDDPVIRSPDR